MQDRVITLDYSSSAENHLFHLIDKMSLIRPCSSQSLGTVIRMNISPRTIYVSILRMLELFCSLYGEYRSFHLNDRNAPFCACSSDIIRLLLVRRNSSVFYVFRIIYLQRFAAIFQKYIT